MKYFICSLFLSVLFHLGLILVNLPLSEHKIHFSKVSGAPQKNGQFILYEIYENKTKSSKRTSKVDHAIKQKKNKTQDRKNSVNNHAKGSVNFGDQELLSKYLSELRDKIANNKIKNAMAERLKLVGKVKLNFLIIKPNLIKDLYISKSSGFPLIDQSALDTVGTTKNLPRIPLELDKEEISVSLEISYE